MVIKVILVLLVLKVLKAILVLLVLKVLKAIPVLPDLLVPRELPEQQVQMLYLLALHQATEQSSRTIQDQRYLLLMFTRAV